MPNDPIITSENQRSVPTNGPITLSNEAVYQAELISQSEPAYQGQSLRIYIEGKGCDGFYYGVSFDKKSPQDLAWQQGSIEIIIDPEALQFMQGSIVNWVDDERGRGFLVDNPQHRQFRGKFYKKRHWVEKLSGTSSATSSSQ